MARSKQHKLSQDKNRNTEPDRLRQKGSRSHESRRPEPFESTTERVNHRAQLLLAPTIMLDRGKLTLLKSLSTTPHGQLKLTKPGEYCQPAVSTDLEGDSRSTPLPCPYPDQHHMRILLSQRMTNPRPYPVRGIASIRGPRSSILSSG